MTPSKRRNRLLERKAIRMEKFPPPGPKAGTGHEHGTNPSAVRFQRTGEKRFYSGQEQRAPRGASPRLIRKR